MNLLDLKGIQKSFYGVRVLHSVNFSLRAGTVHALMGENGAGKSTLMKVIAGIYKQDSGTISVSGKEVEINSPSEAQEHGVAMIHQELTPVREMSVAENIYLGREPGRMGFIDYNKLYGQTEELLEKLNIHINPRVKMKNLRVADQQMVEIAKAISQNSRIYIMDEPTSAITDREVENLFQMIRSMKAQGTGVIYISHKMDEITQIADEVSVLRDGYNINTWKMEAVDTGTLIHSMVGREMTAQFPKREANIGDVTLEVKNLTRSGEYENISFKLHKGEVLGFAGLVGSGRTELMRSLFGLARPDSGEIILNGKKIIFKRPQDAINNGLAFVTESRKDEGLFLPMSVHHNASITCLKQFTRTGLLQNRKEDAAVEKQVRSLQVKAASLRQPVKSLSGGNQQKVVLSKWLMTEPKIIIFDEPTRGIDVGAKLEIYKIMYDYAAAGNAIIMVTSEMPEAIGIADRIIVLSNHKYSGELKREEYSQEAIARLQFLHMSGNTLNDGGTKDE